METKEKMYEVDAEGKAIIPEVKIRRKQKKKTKTDPEGGEPKP